MTRLRVIDLETTGMEPPAEIVEFGRADVAVDGDRVTIERPMARLYRPLHGIPPEAMAVHHITEAEFADDTAVCTPDRLRLAVWGGSAPDVRVAHNAEFEQTFITPAASDALPWTCTYKAALYVWPDAPRHSNQVLRYWRGLKLDPGLAMPPHRAGPDTWVTAHLLKDLLGFASIDQMIAWTAEPRPMPTLPFGKHKGAAWADAPLDYLEWMVRQTDMDADAIWHARRELARRTA